MSDIEIISKLVPKNNAFVGLIDLLQVVPFNVVYRGGGSWTCVPGSTDYDVTWDADIEICNPCTGEILTVSAATLTEVPTGDYLYATPTAWPTSSETISMEHGASIPNGSVAVAIILSGNVYAVPTWNDGGRCSSEGGSNSWVDLTIGVPETLPSAGHVQIYPYYRIENQVPYMTSNTAPSGVASADTEYTPAWYAFSKEGGSQWLSTNVAPPHWLKYQFAAAKTIRAYEIMPWCIDNNWPKRVPTAWTLQGSNDGSSWSDLDTRTALSTDWLQNAYTRFLVATPGSYLYYGLYITSIASGNYVGGKLRLLDYGSTYIDIYARDSSGNAVLFNNGAIW